MPAVAAKNPRRENALVGPGLSGLSLLAGGISSQFDDHTSAIKVKTAKFLIVTDKGVT
jgi:hypothetical protein